MKDSYLLPALLDRAAQFARIVARLHALPVEKAFRVEVSEVKPHRSPAQNRALWGCIYPAILRHLGEQGFEAEDVHEYCLGSWGGWEKVVMFGRPRLRPIRRSSRLSKIEFGEYIAFIQRFMAQEHGIYVPDPDPEWESHSDDDDGDEERAA